MSYLTLRWTNLKIENYKEKIVYFNTLAQKLQAIGYQINITLNDCLPENIDANILQLEKILGEKHGEPTPEGKTTEGQ